MMNFHFLPKHRDQLFSILIGLVCLGLLQVKNYITDQLNRVNPSHADTLADLVFVIILGYLVYQFFRHQRIRRLANLTLSSVDQMKGLDFEHYVAEIMRYQGYSTSVTRSSGDLGIDVIAKQGRTRYAVQVKRYKGPVSRHAVSDAVAGKFHYRCNQAMVVTNSTFTTGAKTLANSTQCLLIDRTQLQKWIDDYKHNTKRTARHLRQLFLLIGALLAAILIRLILFIGS